MNSLFQIKICGITRPDDARTACLAGADAIGLNFYSKSSRYLEPSTATEIVDTIDRFLVGHPGSVKKVGVFVNSPPEQIVACVTHYSLDAIQFHGDEDPTIIAGIQQQLSAKRRSVAMIRAVRTRSERKESKEGGTVGDEISGWFQARADAILLDAAAPESYGGTGKTVDWHWVSRLSCPLPLILAGGLTPENVRQAIRISGVGAVDVASGVESQPGIKDPERIKAFVDSAKATLSEQEQP